MKNSALRNIIEQAARVSGQMVAREHLDDISKALEGCNEEESAKRLISVAWQAAGLVGEITEISEPEPHDCPFLGWNSGWFIVLYQKPDGSWVVQSPEGETLNLEHLNDAECVRLPHKESRSAPAFSALRIVKTALWKTKSAYIDSLVATSLINLLVLSTSIYSMQVYDRVIPNKGMDTLWVLSVGVTLAVFLELLLRHVRASIVEKAAMQMDVEITEWFFRRALGIRLDCRPQSVGTLAAQVSGAQMVRMVMGSASLFVLVDVPFAVFFMIIIAMVGGWTVVVPLVMIPVSVATGLMFQTKIMRLSSENLGQSNKKTGLLVEAIDGAESIKANSAEWKLQARWRHLVSEAGTSDYKIKYFTALSQHITGTLQQASYVLMVALGAYFVAENTLTMGGLIACTIIIGRAMAPVVQLPGIMVQWAQASAAIAGLDKLISLPNEIDDRVTGLHPEVFENSLRFDSTGFVYGAKHEVAIDIKKLEIRAGEKVGIIGSIGSGKSTFLRLASGLYRPHKGAIFLGGIDMSKISPSLLRETVAYLPQDIRLISGTLRDNLLQGLPDLGDEPLINAARQTGLIHLISAHPQGLGLEITEGGHGISGGQRQLIAITRMLLLNPRIVMLDEPTASMDSATEANTIAILKDKVANDVTLLVATHKTAWLSIVDRLLVMQNGMVAVDGPRDAVLAHLAGKPVMVKDDQTASNVMRVQGNSI